MNDLYHVTSLIASQRVSLSVLRDSRTRRDDATEPVSERERRSVNIVDIDSPGSPSISTLSWYHSNQQDDTST
jgi:hypothetical protein